MSFVLSLHGWEGLGLYFGSHVWTVTIGFASLSLTSPRVEEIIEAYRSQL